MFSFKKFKCLWLSKFRYRSQNFLCARHLAVNCLIVYGLYQHLDPEPNDSRLCVMFVFPTPRE